MMSNVFYLAAPEAVRTGPSLLCVLAVITVLCGPQIHKQNWGRFRINPANGQGTELVSHSQ
jgi:hypothetical protein